ncbi:MAG: hypothetical protein U0271_04230 [Polyangiaceae bacterium]
MSSERSLPLMSASTPEPLREGNPRAVFDWVRPGVSFDTLPQRQKLALAGRSLALTTLFAAAWGAAIGCRFGELALGNLWKVPALAVLSACTAAPLGLVAWKLTGESSSATDWLLAHARAMLAGTLLLATTVPVVALYYRSSLVAGPVLAVGLLGLALTAGGAVLVKLARSAAKGPSAQWLRWVVAVAVVAVQGGAVIQLATLMGPFLPDKTMFREGVDGWVRDRQQHERNEPMPMRPPQPHD